MHKKIKNSLFFFLFLSGSFMLITYVYAAPSKTTSKPKLKPRNVAQEVKSKSQSAYEKGKQAAKNKNFNEAYRFLKEANRDGPNNPDILNMLAYSQRKLGKIDEAVENYKKALRLRPRFPEAREYLGEAYIQAALREIEILKSYGSSAHEELEELTEAFKEAAANL